MRQQATEALLPFLAYCLGGEKVIGGRAALQSALADSLSQKNKALSMPQSVPVVGRMARARNELKA